MALDHDYKVLIGNIRRELGSANPVAIVLDTLNRSISGSESNDQHMAIYVKAADALWNEFGCAVIVVHHCGVNKKRPRGHTSLTGAADAQLAVKRDAAGNIEVTVEYMKDGAEGEKIVSCLEQVVVGNDSDGEPITSCIVKPASGLAPPQPTNRKLSDRQQRALDVLQKCIANHGKLAPASLGLPPNVFTIALKEWRDELLSNGVIDSNGSNPRAAFDQIKSGLIARILISASNDLVWLTTTAAGVASVAPLKGGATDTLQIHP